MILALLLILLLLALGGGVVVHPGLFVLAVLALILLALAVRDRRLP